MFNLEEYEKIVPLCELVHGGVEVTFYTPTSGLKWRVDTLFSKEPSTIDWIAGFAAGETLVDVGANVGMYTVWAAKARGVRVFAFEPEAQNFSVLNRNIVLNGLGGQIKAYPVALSDAGGLSELHLSELDAGGSCHSLGERVDYKHEPMQPAFSQGCVSARLDDLVRDGVVPPPHYIKVDVDGFEPKVLHGAREVLKGRQLKSLSIEINHNLEDHRALVAELNAMGFRHDPAQVARAERKEGLFKGCAEYIFRR